MRVMHRRRVRYLKAVLAGLGVVVCALWLLTSLHGSGSTLASVWWLPVPRGPPQLVHQMCSDLASIPLQYRPYAESWLVSHPIHRYMLWTNSGLRELLSRSYPHAANWTRLLLRSRLEFSDVARYYLLLHYGGIYADLDVRARRDLTVYLGDLSQRSAAAGRGRCGCFLGQEPVAHAVLLFGLPWLPSNALMACLPGHKFLRFVTDRLPHYISRRADALPDESDSRLYGFGANKYTGPLMLYRFLRKYELQRQCSPEEPSCSVCLMEPEVTMPYVDASQWDSLHARCRTALAQHALMPHLTRNSLRANFCAGPGAAAIDWRSGSGGGGGHPQLGAVFTEHDFLHLAYGLNPSLGQHRLNASALSVAFPGRVTLVTSDPPDNAAAFA